MGLEVRIREFISENDPINVVERLIDDETDLSMLDYLVDKARRLQKSFQMYKISHITGNKTATMLAKLAINLG